MPVPRCHFLISMKKKKRMKEEEEVWGGRERERNQVSPACWMTARLLKGECCVERSVCVCVCVTWATTHPYSYTVENAYLEEKEDGCNALAEIAENVG